MHLSTCLSVGMSACCCSVPANIWYVPICCTDICAQPPPSAGEAQLLFINNCPGSCWQAWRKELRKVIEQMQSLLQSIDVSCPMSELYGLLQTPTGAQLPHCLGWQHAQVSHSLYKIQRQDGMTTTALGSAMGKWP